MDQEKMVQLHGFLRGISWDRSNSSGIECLYYLYWEIPGNQTWIGLPHKSPTRV